MKILNVGIVGAGFIAQTHADSIKTVPGAKTAALADIDELRGKAFCEKNGIPKFYKSHKELVRDRDIDAIVIGVPNYLHAGIALDAFECGKHVICEKPLAITLEDAERMVAVSRSKGLVLGYAEELCFVPKFIKAKELSASGGIGDVYLVRQCEKHAGPYSPWFFSEEEAGGGILMDMGCHSIECIRWLLGKPKVKSVYAQMGTYLHKEITKEEDHVIILIEFENGAIGQVESSWALKGGMDSTLEIFGTGGVVYADLLKGMGLRAFTENGFENMWEPNKGWVYPDYEWLWNNGYPQEDGHFLDCVRNKTTPEESGGDGLAVLEIMLAAYHSAGIGRKVYLPFRPKGVKSPVYLWQNPRPELGEGPVY
ncbi:MAG: Gfo/Idh/MocA family oxidoreductase [Deltaproteobacteria bacterium]|nr:Gfo/Idh/MocA family oxidoreductase [Deltaproteobacteria bacterium]